MLPSRIQIVIVLRHAKGHVTRVRPCRRLRSGIAAGARRKIPQHGIEAVILLTYEDVMLLSPRELDVQIAKRLMGLNVVALDWPCGRECECGDYIAAAYREQADDTHYIDRGPVYAATGDDWPPRFCQLGGRPVWMATVQPVPFYSSDIAQAWQVYLRAMQNPHSIKQRFYVVLERLAYELAGERVAWPHVLTVLRDEMPTAICRAALSM